MMATHLKKSSRILPRIVLKNDLDFYSSALEPNPREILGKLRKHNRFQSRWNNTSAHELEGILRRAIEVAYHNAKAATVGYSQSGDLDRLVELEQLSSKTLHSLTSLVLFLSGEQPKTRQKWQAQVPAEKAATIYRAGAALCNQLRFRQRSMRADNFSPADNRRIAREDSEAIVRCFEILELARNEALNRGASLRSKITNPGRPELKAFASIMMDIWIYLTGYCPGQRNPAFNDFVSECWNVVSTTEADWERAIRANSSKVEEAALLAETGPDWL